MLEDFLKKKDNPALPMQIAYYTGLRIGEACALTWQDINLDGQYLTVRRSMRYNRQRHKTEMSATKRKKVRTVDFCDTLADILRKAKTEQHRAASSMANSTASITIKRSRRKTVLTMKSTACRERMKCQTDTRKYPLSALDLTEHTSHRVRLVL